MNLQLSFSGFLSRIIILVGLILFSGLVWGQQHPDKKSNTDDTRVDTEMDQLPDDDTYHQDADCMGFYQGVTNEHVIVSMTTSALGYGRQKVSTDDADFMEVLRAVAYNACYCGWRRNPELPCRIRLSGTGQDEQHFILKYTDRVSEDDGSFGFGDNEAGGDSESGEITRINNSDSSPDAAFLTDDRNYQISIATEPNKGTMSIGEDDRIILSTTDPDSPNKEKNRSDNFSWEFRNVNYTDQSSGIYICFGNTEYMIVRGYRDEVMLKPFSECSASELERARWDYRFSGRDKAGNQLYQFLSKSSDEPVRYLTKSADTDRVTLTDNPMSTYASWKVDMLENDGK